MLITLHGHHTKEILQTPKENIYLNSSLIITFTTQIQKSPLTSQQTHLLYWILL